MILLPQTELSEPIIEFADIVPLSRRRARSDRNRFQRIDAVAIGACSRCVLFPSQIDVAQ